MVQVKIRTARSEDAAGLRACIQAAYAPARQRGVLLPPVDEGVEEDIATNLVWVAEYDGAVAGGLIVAPVDDALHVMNLVVHPNAQGQGVARKLLSLAETHALTHGLSELRLATHRDMPENIALYQHLGWEENSREGVKVVMIKSVGG